MTALDELRAEVLRAVGQYGTDDPEVALNAVRDWIELQTPDVVNACLLDLLDGEPEKMFSQLWAFIHGPHGDEDEHDLDEHVVMRDFLLYLLVNESNGALDAALTLAIGWDDEDVPR
jgi:hypothetical protein